MYAHTSAMNTMQPILYNGIDDTEAYYTNAIHVAWTKHAHKMSTSCIATRAESYSNYA